MTATLGTQRRVLRIYHAGVVDEWRARERAMIREGFDVRLVSSHAWNEGGAVVQLEPGADRFVTGVRTFGHHPNLFAYDPLAIWRLLRDGCYDVLDIHEEPVSIAAAEVQLLAALGRVRIPLALYSAQNISKRYPIPFRWLERVALQRAAAVHTCNDEAGRIVRRKGFRGVVRNLGLGVDVAPAAQIVDSAPSQGLRVGYVGRLEEHKGVHILIDAVARTPGCTLQIVGDGPQRPALETRIASSGAGARINLVGYVQHGEISNRYRDFDVLAVPSLKTRAWVEQFGRAALEAMANGIPVVASESGALPEVVGESGVLVPPGHVGAWAAALGSLVDNPCELPRLGARARERAEYYSWNNVARRHVELYREMLARGP